MSGYSRGGLWTNAEDEVLKAAVQKYGLTQWSRCSSLLNRKTAKQCKSRWFNWLSPSVKKSDWTPQEDERLLELAKVLPNQWQTVAPLVGRTPNQCIERYTKLLDDLDQTTLLGDSGSGGLIAAANAEAMAPVGPKVNLHDIRDDGMGNVPELKPARPDAIEMDDDEREMISEARARLANTQGKKAKRKQRERMLAQSRRVALLQKRRELKGAGFNVDKSIVSRGQKKKMANFMDYNNDVPFERRPEVVAYDIAAEEGRDKRDKESFQKTLATKPDFQNERDPRRKKGVKSQQKNKGSLVITAPEDVETDDSEVLLGKKGKLELPAPKHDVDQQQNEEKDREVRSHLARIAADEGISLDQVKDKIESGDEWLRTKLKESSDEKIKRLGTDIIAFNNLQSTLLEARDGEIEDEEKIEEEKVEKKRRVNVEKQKKKEALVRSREVEKRLRKRFAQLPQPKNDFEIGIDESSDEEEQQQQDTILANENQKKQSQAATSKAQDLGEIKAQEEKLKRERLKQKQQLRSQAVLRKLPLPYVDSKAKTLQKFSRVPIFPLTAKSLGLSDSKKNSKGKRQQAVQKLLDTEMLNLIVSDYLKLEYLGDPEDLARDPALKNDIVDDLDREARESVLALVKEEIAERQEDEQIVAKAVGEVIATRSYALPGLT